MGLQGPQIAMTEKAFYQQVVNEMTTGEYDDALWAMVWAKANGDDSKAKAGYIKHRLSELKSSARQENREQLRALWRDALRLLPRRPALWWTLVLLAGLNVIYFSECYHHAVGTGKVAAIGALLGFNLLPFAASDRASNSITKASRSARLYRVFPMTR